MPVLFRPQQTIDKLRPRIPADVYQTPLLLAEAVTSWVKFNFIWPERTITFLDPGAGSGVWGLAIRSQFENANIVGVELRNLKQKPSYNNWLSGVDFTGSKIPSSNPFDPFDVVIGNPPFIAAEAFIRTGLQLLDDSGILVYLLPSDFLHGKRRAEGLFKEHSPIHILHLSPRPNFVGPRGESLGKAQTDNFIVGVWRKSASPIVAPATSWLIWK